MYRRRFFFRRRFGVTLVELMIATSIMGVVFVLTKFGGDLLKQMMQERSFVDAQRQAELAMYRIKIDVNSSQTIFFISSTTVKMTLFDFKKGYDVAISTNLFSDVNLATVTYAYTMNGLTPSLVRQIEQTDGSVHNETFLSGLLQRDTATEPVFLTGHTDALEAPFQSVQVFFNLQLPYGQNVKKYQQEFSKRGFFS